MPISSRSTIPFITLQMAENENIVVDLHSLLYNHFPTFNIGINLLFNIE